MERLLEATATVSHSHCRDSKRGKWYWFNASIRLGLLASLTVACGTQEGSPTVSAEFDSRHNDEQPALSGDGRFLAFVSNRNGNRGILLYDLKQRQLVDLPRLNRGDAIAESPSLSYTGRYIVYVTSASGLSINC